MGLLVGCLPCILQLTLSPSPSLSRQERGVPLLQVTFASPVEARRRALLLMQRTFDPSDGTFTAFLTRDMLAQSWLEAPGAVALPSRCASYGVGIPLLRTPSPRPRRSLEAAGPGSPRAGAPESRRSPSQRHAATTDSVWLEEEGPALHHETLHRATTAAEAASQQLTSKAERLKEGAEQARAAFRMLRGSQQLNSGRTVDSLTVRKEPHVPSRPSQHGLAASPSRRRVSLQREPSTGTLSVSSRAEVAAVGLWGDEDGPDNADVDAAAAASGSDTRQPRRATAERTAGDAPPVTAGEVGSPQVAPVSATLPDAADAVVPTLPPSPLRYLPVTTAPGSTRRGYESTHGLSPPPHSPQARHDTFAASASVPPLALPTAASATARPAHSSARTRGRWAPGLVPQPPSKPKRPEAGARRRPQSATAARRRVASEGGDGDSGAAGAGSGESLAAEGSAEAVPRLPVASPRAEPLAAAATARMVRVDRTLAGFLVGWRRAAEEAAHAETRRQVAAEAVQSRARRMVRGGMGHLSPVCHDSTVHAL